jgi:hypothetical protein
LAFNPAELAELLRARIGLRLDRVADPSHPYSTQVFQVVELADRAGWIGDLVRAACEARPSHEGLAALYRQLGLTVALDYAPQGTAAVGGGTASTEVTRREGAAPEDVPVAFGDATELLRRVNQITPRVCRVEVDGRIRGNGFLIEPDTVLTTCAVAVDLLENRVQPASVCCRFDYRVLPSGEIFSGVSVPLKPSDWEVASSPPLDFVVLRLSRPVGQEPVPPAGPGAPPRGWIELPTAAAPTALGGPLFLPHSAPDGTLVLATGERLDDPETPPDRVRYAISTHAGSAGAPCVDHEMNLLAVHQSAAVGEGGSDGFGQGLLATVVRDYLARLGQAPSLTVSFSQPASSVVPLEHRPPEPGPIVHRDDPQRDRWGSIPERDGRRLSVNLLDTSGRVFSFDAIVESTDGSALVGPVRLHLHDTFPQPKIVIRRVREARRAVLEEVVSYGVFTIGAQVKNAQGQWIGLEFNLCDLPDLPQRFKER